MRYVVFLAAMAAQAASAAAPGANARAPTLAEQRSFEQFMQRTAPGTPVPPLRLELSRDGKKWIASASTDAAPVRLVLPLCRVSRTRYTQQADDSWRGETSQHVWIHHTTNCGMPPATMAELRAPLAEIDMLRLIQAQGELLQRARLLMAGNTNCAPTRSRSFQLRALGRSKDGMFLLGYESDIGSKADITVRQARAELVAWNVNCP
ncbi:hypothetical protein SAMN05518865_12545 [Duganella sp. CF458]|uniref:hypothetical protein n=1 Tax=Duganella sp. CF458 TaxID=1884368 RepID=UPI0008E85693|nr:hypothetical protein [Duganella sp. CF458]SFG96446.1 hypothetical protein SAMN05518865_12545 [Duganella sp. CF458]